VATTALFTKQGFVNVGSAPATIPENITVPGSSTVLQPGESRAFTPEERAYQVEVGQQGGLVQDWMEHAQAAAHVLPALGGPLATAGLFFQQYAASQREEAAEAAARAEQEALRSVLSGISSQTRGAELAASRAISGLESALQRVTSGLGSEISTLRSAISSAGAMSPSGISELLRYQRLPGRARGAGLRLRRRVRRIFPWGVME